MGHVEHHALGPRSVGCFVVTVSDTRTLDTDTSGAAIIDLLAGAGHRVEGRAIVSDSTAAVRDAVEKALAVREVQAIIVTGGTGITSRDTTFEAIERILEKRLDGFGEIFRMLSYQHIGPAAMMSRALAGLASGRVVFALPGSEAAVRLALEKLLIPELGHLVQQAST